LSRGPRQRGPDTIIANQYSEGGRGFKIGRGLSAINPWKGDFGVGAGRGAASPQGPAVSFGLTGESLPGGRFGGDKKTPLRSGVFVRRRLSRQKVQAVMRSSASEGSRST
jgi:hypothetical protein